jgi:hypothetical protein
LTGLKWLRTGQVVDSKNVENFLSSWEIVGFQEELYCIKFCSFWIGRTGNDCWGELQNRVQNKRNISTLTSIRQKVRKRDEVTEERRKLHNEELNDLFSSPNIVRVIKSRIMRCVEHVARMCEIRGVYRVLVGKETTCKIQA